ncbi:MAG: aromatic ring-hydroxylating dioxygenase subunit alpha, partial [Ignavibacteria bacterium]|nr:aromatic ring-hydroxylating dioxygenase subunit alpha [Ignavibacteria bacterium]
MKINIDPDIRKAETLPAEFYRSETVYEVLKRKVFTRTWHLVCDTDKIKIPGTIYPFTMLEGYLNEPLLLTSDHND